MNSVKRAVLYISRKKGKTVSMFLLMLIVSTFLITCFAVLDASKKLSKDIRGSIGAAFYLRASTDVSLNKNGEAEVKENSANILQKEVESIIQLGGIKYYNPVNYGFAKSDELNFIPGYGHNNESNMGKVIALSYSALDKDFMDETVALIQGKHITVKDKKQILISEQLAEVNHLNVGDIITLTHAKLAEKDGEYIDEIKEKTVFTQVAVSGIYKLNVEDTGIKPTAGVSDNKIYASLDVLNELKESKIGIYTGEVDFYITDPGKMESIVADTRKLQGIDWTTHFIRTNDFKYSRIADKLSSLGDIVKILLICVSVVSTVILTLILTMRIRGRMQEAGVLMAAGITKVQIIQQFIIEVTSITVIAFVFSYFISQGVIHLLDGVLFEEIKPNLINDAILEKGFNVIGQINPYLKLKGIKIFTIYGCQIAIVVASTLVSATMIMRLKPKEILSRI